MIIGIDDTDSRDGMCTTYLGVVLMDELQQYGTVIGDPLLIRLNPTIPYKTRGNASIAIRLDTDRPNEVMGHVTSRIESLAQMDCERTNPGVVFVKDTGHEHARAVLEEFFIRTVREVISIDTAKNIIHDLGLPAKGYKNGRGLIGALAACGAMLRDGWDHTYEYLAYRQMAVWGTPRIVDEESVWKADMATYPDTWDTIDQANDLVVCVPHSPDPVLFGIRGKTVEAVTSASNMIVSEPIERYAIFRTDQGTDLHLIPVERIADIQDMHSYTIEARICEPPHTIRGGHTIVPVCDRDGRCIDCAAFEPTKNFRNLIRELIPDDMVRVSGSVKENTLNIEKIEIISLARAYDISNPTCPSCGKRMKSAGIDQGYRCRKCGTRSDTLQQRERERNIAPGIYEVPPCARRHLAKPLVRTHQANAFPSR